VSVYIVRMVSEGVRDGPIDCLLFGLSHSGNKIIIIVFVN